MRRVCNFGRKKVFASFRIESRMNSLGYALPYYDVLGSGRATSTLKDVVDWRLNNNGDFGLLGVGQKLAKSV